MQPDLKEKLLAIVNKSQKDLYKLPPEEVLESMLSELRLLSMVTKLGIRLSDVAIKDRPRPIQ